MSVIAVGTSLVTKVAVGAAAGAIGSALGGSDSGGATASNDTSAASLAMQQAAYDNSVAYFEGKDIETTIATGRDYLALEPVMVTPAVATGYSATGHAATGYAAEGFEATGYEATGYAAEGFAAEGFAAESFNAEAAMVEMENFLESFNQALGANSDAIVTFNERFGPIMDNVQLSIEEVSRDRFAAAGREQLSLDMATLGNSFTQSMASKNITRSGLTVETEQRLASEAAQMARDIDVKSYEQAMALQALGVNTLNSMESIRQGVYARTEGIYMNEAQGYLNASMLDAQNATQVSMQNASLATNASMATAQNMTQASMATAGNLTNASMATAGNMTNASMASAGNLTNASIASAQNMTDASRTTALNNTNASIATASNLTNASIQSASNLTSASINSALLANQANLANASAVNDTRVNLANSFITPGMADLNATNTFYSGVGTSALAGTADASDTLAAAQQADTDGYVKLANEAFQDFSIPGAGDSYDTYYDYF